MARPPAKSEGSGKGKLIGNIAFFAFLIGVGVYFAIEMMQPSDDEILSRQLDPASAMTVYLEHADGFIHAQSLAGEVQKTVAKDDWQWLQDNHESIFAKYDAIGLQSAADPTVVMVGGRLAVLKMLLEGGPNRKDSVIVSTTETSESTADLVVRQKIFYGGGSYDYTDYKVRMVKEGKYWKVKDYAGGKQVMEGTRQPGDAVFRDREEVEGGAVANAAGGDPAAASAAVPGGQPAQPGAPGAAIATIEQADAAVIEARRAWEAGDAQTAYDEALKAYGFYSTQLGPDDPRTQQTMAMGRKARETLVQQGVLQP